MKKTYVDEIPNGNVRKPKYNALLDDLMTSNHRAIRLEFESYDEARKEYRAIYMLIKRLSLDVKLKAYGKDIYVINNKYHA